MSENRKTNALVKILTPIRRIYLRCETFPGIFGNVFRGLETPEWCFDLLELQDRPAQEGKKCPRTTKVAAGSATASELLTSLSTAAKGCTSHHMALRQSTR